ncbi:MAG: hypothetical protein CW716_10290 [Candidatus Bathyarchaeum sp.]|nr:MAG: hypothetical protein CW716_10290 [Candidatus Bathyarchaeum sp.]
MHEQAYLYQSGNFRFRMFPFSIIRYARASENPCLHKDLYATNKAEWALESSHSSRMWGFVHFPFLFLKPQQTPEILKHISQFRKIA